MTLQSGTDVKLHPSLEEIGFIHGPAAVRQALHTHRQEAANGHSFNPNRHDLGGVTGRDAVHTTLQEHRNGIVLNPQQHEPALAQGAQVTQELGAQRGAHLLDPKQHEPALAQGHQVGQELGAQRSGVTLDPNQFTMESAHGKEAVSKMLGGARQQKTLEVARGRADVQRAIDDMSGAVQGKQGSFAQAVRESQTPKKGPPGRG